jgi:hypothetical protein
VIGALLRLCDDRWHRWLGRRPTSPLHGVALSNTRVTARRLLVLVFEGSRPEPTVVVKTSDGEAGPWLRDEWDGLRIANAAAAGGRWRVPVPLDLVTDAGPTVLVVTAVPGAPLRRPRNRWGLSRWIRHQRTLHGTLRSLGGPEGRPPSPEPPDRLVGRAGGLAEHIELGWLDALRADLVDLEPEPPRWQHGDVAAANALFTGDGDLGLIDWELAGWYEPWFDEMCLFLIPALARRSALDDEASKRLLSQVVLPSWRWGVPVQQAAVLTALRCAVRADELGRGTSQRWLELASHLHRTSWPSP